MQLDGLNDSMCLRVMANNDPIKTEKNCFFSFYFNRFSLFNLRFVDLKEYDIKTY